MRTSQNKEARWWGLSWGMLQGYDSGYDSGVWFGNIALSFRTSINLHVHKLVQNQFPSVGEVLLSKCVMRFGAGMLLPLRVLLSEWYVHFGAGMLVPLECRCKVLVQGVACCHSDACSFEWALGMLVPLQSAARCCLGVMLEGAAVRVACAL